MEAIYEAQIDVRLGQRKAVTSDTGAGTWGDEGDAEADEEAMPQPKTRKWVSERVELLFEIIMHIDLPF